MKQSKQVQLYNTNIQNRYTTIKTKQAKFSLEGIGINIVIFSRSGGTEVNFLLGRWTVISYNLFVFNLRLLALADWVMLLSSLGIGDEFVPWIIRYRCHRRILLGD